MKPMEQRLEELQKCALIQLSDGNWDYDSYMFGLAQGLILAEHIMADRDGEPAFRNAPAQWRKDRCEPLSPEKETTTWKN